MRNSKKINRNHWSNEELATLHQCVHQAEKVGTGLANAAKKLGRTQAACTFKYYKTNTAVTSAAVAPKMHNVKVQAPPPQPAPLATIPAAAGPVTFPAAAIAEAQRHFDRAVVMVEMARSHDDFLLALKEFEQAASLVPVWADAHYNLAVLQEAVGRQRDALGNYKRYLALAPNASDADKVRARVELLEKTRMRGPGSSR